MRLTQTLLRAELVRAQAVATIDGDRVRTWREVANRVRRLSGALRGLGVGEGDRVAVLAQNCDSYFEAYFAILWTGAVIVPLNTRLAPAETRFQLEDAGARALLFGEEFAETAAILKPHLSKITAWIGMDGPGGAADHALEDLVDRGPAAAETERRAEDLAGIFYTGGTTGLPKGVMLSHRALAAMAVNLTMSLKVDETIVNLHSAPMFHLADIGTFMATMVGGAHVFVRKLDETVMLDLIGRHGITHIFTVPAMIDRLARHPRAGETDLSSLRVLGYGGAPMPMGTYDVARARFPDVDIVQGFGMTEMGAHTFLEARHHRPGADPEKMKSVGQPAYGYEVRVVDPEGREVPRRQLGEIIGRGDNMMTGYWNRPEETAQALRGGWVWSGDAGFMDEEGFVYITDRFKDMIVSGGENVYSIEVENVVSRHPAVMECAIIGVPDDRWGERVHAVVVLKPGAALALDDLDAHCRAEIAGYKIPRSLQILDQPLPRSGAGKVLKTELRAPWWAGRERKV
ncbi:acyl-CoA synthetase [Phenylobacterium aquaticum]|uniref:acyl-CoA synthetase n=1 Tax=Phenylobacterium aquaticum TaxID=1763816 RepID=UPI001F5D5208|nr:long-chain fatty acid--CoA ligase [Phenylobacterium aquaticum]MCI3134791.1 long-chain fatty acid--CoA ligase [Phenylobacterium aquaticum]